MAKNIVELTRSEYKTLLETTYKLEMTSSKIVPKSEISGSIKNSIVRSIIVENQDKATVDELKQLLSRAKIIDPEYEEIINIGSTFQAEMDYFGEIENVEFNLVAPGDSSSLENKIPSNSPFGLAVKANIEGECFMYPAPNGEMVHGKIAKIIKEKKLEKTK